MPSLRSINEAMTVPYLIELAGCRIFVPVGSDMLDVQAAADHWAKCRVVLDAIGTYSLISPRPRIRGAKWKPSRCTTAKT